MSGSSSAYPISPQQQRLWLAHGVDLEARCVVAISGLESPAPLELGLAELVRRHEILRTRFTLPRGSRLPFQVVDGGETSAALRHRIEPAGDRRWRLTLVLPALCGDFVAFGNLVAELAALIAGQRSVAEPLQYADYADWQNELNGNPAEITVRPPTLPFEAPGEAAAGAQMVLRWRPEAATQAELERVAAALACERQDLLLAAWRALLWRYESDATLWLPAPMRGNDELALGVGLYELWQPMAAAFEGDSSLGREAGICRRLLGQAASGSGTSEPLPAAAVGFEVVRWPTPRLQGEARFEIVERDVPPGELSLALAVLESESGEGIELELRAAARAMDPGLAAGLAESYRQLLAAALAAPSTPFSRLPLLSAATARAQVDVLHAELDHGASAAELAPVHVQLARAAARAPEMPALRFEEQSLSYGELNRRANRLARVLLRRGVGLDLPVAICLERGLDLFVALLAVLKAGGAYAPIEPGQPPLRLGKMLAGIGARWLLTRPELAPGDGWADTAGGTVGLWLEEELTAAAVEPDSDPRLEVPPEALAYVIFTSGSTGEPKGVAVAHGQLSGYVAAVRHRLRLDACESFATVSTMAADLGLTAVYPALTSGATLHVISPQRATDPASMAAYCLRFSIDALKIVPGHLEALMAYDQPQELLPKKRLILGGETLRPDFARRLAALLPAGSLLINHYGPTETTVGAASWLSPISGGELHLPAACRSVPIGGALPNARLYLLDAGLRPQPAGLTAELSIGGDGVSRGYLRQPRLTASRFLPDAFGDSPGARMYRTGDLVRLLPSGLVEFLGRADQQVKIRGFRVELGEIEAALAAHPQVRRGVVVLRAELAGRPVAYYSCRTASGPSQDELMAFLRQRLPEPMLPAAFVQLNELPLSKNGKVDRAALPAPDAQLKSGRPPYAPPESDNEKVLATIWERLLGVSEVGLDDNFFELGGDSIMGIQVVARAGQLGVVLTPLQIFQCQTLRALAAVAGMKAAVTAEQGAVEGAVPLTPIQQRFFALDNPEPWHWNQAVLSQARELLLPAAVEAALAVLVAHHDALRLRFTAGPEGWHQEHGPVGRTPSLRRVQLGSLPRAEALARVAEVAGQLQRGFDLGQEPLFTAALFEHEQDPPLLLLVAHHLVVDGLSWRILLEDFESAYHRLAAGDEPVLPAKTSSFRGWAEAQVAAAPARAAAERGYWTAASRRLASPLPVDGPGGSNLEGEVSKLTLKLGRETTAALLRDLPRRHRARSEEILLAALGRVLTAWSGDPGWWVDLERHGRDETGACDLSRTVGWFTAVVPVRFDFSGVDGRASALARVKEQLAELPGGGLGWGLLRHGADAALAAELAAQPAPQLSFNYLGQFGETSGEQGLLRLLGAELGSAQSPRSARWHQLDVGCLVAAGELVTIWTYNERFHRRGTVERLATEWLAELETMTAAAEPSALSTADFPLAELGHGELEAVARLLGEDVARRVS